MPEDKEDNGSSIYKEPEIIIKEPEIEESPQFKLPVIRKNTQIRDLLNHNIYYENENKMKSINSRGTLTSRKKNNSSRLSQDSKTSSINSHTKSTVSIFKDRYDKNIESYLNSLELRSSGRKNYSSNVSKLLSPNFTKTKDKGFEL